MFNKLAGSLKLKILKKTCHTNSYTCTHTYTFWWSAMWCFNSSFWKSICTFIFFNLWYFQHKMGMWDYDPILVSWGVSVILNFWVKFKVPPGKLGIDRWSLGEIDMHIYLRIWSSQENLWLIRLSLFKLATMNCQILTV